jgi:lipooligosaccharide transport system ATP-binding protein
VPALAIRLRGVVKNYGAVTAVAGLDLDLPEGTCVGLLGPNGAGKSTTMKLLTAQAIADEGELEVLGHTLPGDSKAARAVMGVVPQLDNLDTTLTVEQNLLVFTYLYRVPRAERRAAIERALTIANLGDRRKARVDQLSGGMRRRLLIARALVHEPRLVLLDEPTVGLDPQVRQELWALIDRLRSEGVSILMSTHYIEEAERLADSVTVMSHGQAVAVGRPTWSPSTRAARRSRYTARRRGCARSRRRRASAAGRRAAPAPASRSSVSTGSTATCPRASGARRRSRTSSCF